MREANPDKVSLLKLANYIELYEKTQGPWPVDLADATELRAIAEKMSDAKPMSLHELIEGCTDDNSHPLLTETVSAQEHVDIGLEPVVISKWFKEDGMHRLFTGDFKQDRADFYIDGALVALVPKGI